MLKDLAVFLSVFLFTALMFLFAWTAWGQSAPVLNWTQGIDGYQIERSFDTGANFKVVAVVPPDVLTYTDNTALAESPVGVTQVCYRIIPLLFSGPAFFNDPVCQPFTNVLPVTATYAGVTQDRVGTNSLAPDGKADRQIILANVVKPIASVRITYSCGNGSYTCGFQHPANGTDYVIGVFVRPGAPGVSAVDLFWANVGNVTPITVALTYTDKTTLTLTVTP